MSASHTVSGTAISKLRSSMFGATACACRLSVVIGTRCFPRGGRMKPAVVLLAGRRDLRAGQGALEVPLPCDRQRGCDARLLPRRPAQCQGGQTTPRVINTDKNPAYGE